MADVLVNIKPKANKKKWYRSPKVLRHAVMAFFFLFLLHVAWEHQVQGGGPNGTPSVESYCPFGGLETLYQFITTGGFVRRIEPSALVLLAAVLLVTLLASRGFCGWVCPFGSVQEWLGLLGRKIFRKRFNPTGAWDRGLRYLKYVILALVIALTWHTGSLVFRDYDPFLAFFHLGNGFSELRWAYAALAVVLAGSLYIERFFCKYACPLGAALAIVGKAGLTKIERDASTCKECNLCSKKCHAHIDFLSVTTIRDSECNQCMDCVVDCPKPNVLTVRGPKWRLSHPVYASILVVGIFAVIGASQLAGKWQPKPEAVSFTDRAGKLDPENIRGWMTLAEISQGYSMPLERLYRDAGIPSRVPPTMRINAIAGKYELPFQPDSVRGIVEKFLAGVPSAPPTPTQPGQAAGSEGEEVRGTMTLTEIALKTGVPQAHLLKSLGAPSDINPRIPVRDWLHSQGKSMQDVREIVKSFRWQR